MVLVTDEINWTLEKCQLLRLETGAKGKKGLRFLLRDSIGFD